MKSSSCRAVILASLMALVAGGVAAQDGVRPSEGLRSVQARHIQASPRVDGRLDEDDWHTGQTASSFVQREPKEGAPAPEVTDVRFLYTDDALYIGARMASAPGETIRPLVARRDREPPSEELIVSLDTRGDRRTAYTFAVTPAGGRVDFYHPSDFEGARDYTYDPVWEVATTIDSAGWTAEVRIPFTQLRFNPGDRLVWGLNIMRRIPSRNEEAFWVPLRRNETGWASRMGRLVGLDDLAASRRVELLPYVAANGTRMGQFDPADPFASRYDGSVRAGTDFKMGLGPNMTLDATLNPDFGQVEADPAVVNLTAFETFFPERRPFFLEGSDLLGGRGTFYSRRIGAPPAGAAATPYAGGVGNSTILGAAKLSGRLPSGLALGGLAALTARERVATYDPASGVFGSADVAPVTGYGVVTARQEFGANASTVSATLTAVERDVASGSALASVVTRSAYTGVIDGRLRWGGGKYDASAYLGFSRVAGDSTVILALQRSSRRYYQRPDATHVHLDSGATTLGGVIAGINHSKLGGDWRWDVDYYEERPGFEPNDMGFLGAADDRGLAGDIFYTRSRPGALFRRWQLGVFQSNEWNFGGVLNYRDFGAFGSLTFHNFWQADGQVSVVVPALSDNLTRGGPLMRTPRRRHAEAGLRNSSGARTRWRLNTEASTDELDGWSASANGSLALRPGTRWDVSLEPRYTRSVTAQQYVATRAGGPAATYGSRYVFAHVDRSEIVARVRVSYAIGPDLTLEGYVEPFASSGRYRDLGELRAARGFDLRAYGTDGTTLTRDSTGYTITDGAQAFTFSDPDFNIRSFRSNLVIRWEWRPGSTLYLVWQQSRFADRSVVANVGPGGLWQAFGAPGDQFIAIKASYWIPVR